MVGTSALSRSRIQLERFLLDQPLGLSERQRNEILNGAEMDDAGLEREREIWIQAGQRVRKLRTTWNMYRDALISSGEPRVCPLLT